MKWELDDIVSVGDIAQEFGVRRSVVCNWRSRHRSFPAPLKRTAQGRLYSMRQIRRWRNECVRPSE